MTNTARIETEAGSHRRRRAEGGEMSRLQPGAVLSHYQIQAWVARGGMAEVYRAVDLRLGRTVAIKILSPSLMADPEARRRFFREARAASALQHPNICAVYEVGEAEGIVFIAMPYIAGRTLKEILEQGPVPLERALGYAIDIADALEEAHRQGIIHRDIKPSNVIVDERDRAIVLDFGLAKRVRLEGRDPGEALTLSQITTTSALIGTTPYMSPEQVRGEPLDARSDIFAFGTLLYELLTGQRPFRGATTVEVLHAILHDEPEPMSAIGPPVDFELERIVRKALRKNPADRYQTISEMKADLVTFAREKGYATSGLRIVAVPPTVRERRRWPWRALVTRVGGMFAMGVAMALALWLLLRSDGDAKWIAALRHVQLANWKNEPGESPPRVRFSPDGKMIVFASRKGGHPDLWIQQTLGGTAVPVTRDEWVERSPLWSPDGQQIAFLSDRGGELGIWVIPALGGVPTLLHVVSPAASARLSPVNLIAWSATRNLIYYEAQRNLYALDVASRRATALTAFDPQRARVMDFCLSPDERRLAYVDVQGGQVDIWVLSLDGGRRMRVTESPEEERFPVWHPDGRRLFYSCKWGEAYQICVVDVSERTPLRLTSGDADLFVSDVSADGRRVLYTLSKDDADIWAVDLHTGEEVQVTTEIGLELWPTVSPDGRAIAFQAKPEASAGGDLFRAQIVVRTLGGEEPTIRFTTAGFDPAWSPDGRHLAFLRRGSDGQLDLWIVPASGGAERRVVRAGVYHGGYGLLPFNRLQTRDFSWSPDGRRLAYAAIRTGVSNIWIASLDRSEEIPVTENADRALSFFCPLWSPDGRYLAFLSESRATSEARWTVWVSEVGRKRVIPLMRSPEVVRLIGWLSFGGALLVAIGEGPRLLPHAAREIRLIRVSVPDGATRSLGTLAAASLLTLSLSPDGRAIAYVSRADGRDNLWVLPLERGRAVRRTENKDPRVYLSTPTWSPDGRMLYYGRQASWSVIRMIENFP
ncbi:Serine/threonine-protein kinase PknB [bacterium HR08]|nr:Serine/threonine-protein kinase PknB [bacterium HR08]